MDLSVEIQNGLNQVAPCLFELGIGHATQVVHDVFEDLAFVYADAAGFGFGTHTDPDPASKNPTSDKRMLVYRSRQSKWRERGTQGGYLFDHCWLVFNNDKAPADCKGRLAGCELAMESEFVYDNDEPGIEYSFLQDFRKLLIAKARTKVFVFRSRTKSAQDSTFQKLQAEIRSFGADHDPRSSYLLCGWHLGSFSYISASA